MTPASPATVTQAPAAAEAASTTTQPAVASTTTEKSLSDVVKEVSTGLSVAASGNHVALKLQVV